MGLARQAARKLVPVVLTLENFLRDGRSFRGLGKPAPSFARAPLLWRWGLARRASQNNFGATAKASATAMANPRRRSRTLLYFGAGGWPVGLPETIFRATAKASATASLALASVVLALGSGRTGFPKQVSERCKAGGSWTPPRHMRPEAYVATRAAQIIKGEDRAERTNGQISRVGLRMADFILSRIRSSSAAKPSHFYQGLAEWQLYQGRPAAVAVLSKRLQFYAYGRFINDGRFIKTPFYQSEAGQMACWAADGRFHSVPHKQFINGQVEPC